MSAPLIATCAHVPGLGYLVTVSRADGEPVYGVGEEPGAVPAACYWSPTLADVADELRAVRARGANVELHHEVP